LSVFGTLLEAVLEHTVYDTPDTEGRLNDVGNVLFLLRGACLFNEADHVRGESEFFRVLGDCD